MTERPERVLAIDADLQMVRGIVLTAGSPAVAGGYAQLAFDPSAGPAAFAARIAVALDVKCDLPVVVTCADTLGPEARDQIVAAIAEAGFVSVAVEDRARATLRSNPTQSVPESLVDIDIPSGLLTSHAGLSLEDLAPVVGAGLGALGQGAPLVEAPTDDTIVAVWSPASDAPLAPATDPFTGAPLADEAATGVVAADALAPTFDVDDDLTVGAPGTAPFVADLAPAVDEVTELPDEVTELPDEVTELPDEVTELPDEVTELPDEVTELPDEVTELPGEVTDLSSLAGAGTAIVGGEHAGEAVAAIETQQPLPASPVPAAVPGEPASPVPAAAPVVPASPVPAAAPVVPASPVQPAAPVVPASPVPAAASDPAPTATVNEDETSRSNRPLVLLLAVLVLVALAGLVFSQCGGSGSDDIASPDPDATAEAATAAGTSTEETPAVEPPLALADPTAEPDSAPAATAIAEPTPEPTPQPTAEPANTPEPEPTTDPLEGLPPLSSLPERGAVFRPPTLFLEGPVQTQEQADAFYEAAIAVVGPDNVVNNYVVRPDAPASIDGNVRVEQAVLFETGSAVISEQFIPTLELGVAVMTLNPQVQMIVEGHTDSVGSEEGNVALSQRRAQAVVDYLVSRGVDAARLQPVGLGEGSPVAPNDTAEGRQINRRIEVDLLDLLATGD